MNIAVAGALVMTVFVVSAMTLTSTLFTTSFAQGDALKQAAEVEREQLGTMLSVSSSKQFTTAGYSTATLLVDNPGATTLIDRDEMDLIVSYTAPDGTATVTRLTYVDSASPGDNQWTISTIEPDTFNPGLWDPSETATIKARVAPPFKTAGVATIIIGAPNGVTTSVSLSS